MRFSEKYGFTPVRDVIQTDSIDEPLRNSLWSLLKLVYWDTISRANEYNSGRYLSDRANSDLNDLCRILWLDFFKRPLDKLSDDWQDVYEKLRQFFFGCEWYEVYDFIEFVANNYKHDDRNAKFRAACNEYLEREVSGYRFVDAYVTRVVEEEEIAAIEEAVQSQEGPVRDHINRALALLSDRQNPDYRNSIKESISAVEALARKITSSEKGTLGRLLITLESEHGLHPALRESFSKLYGYSSDADGIRHALMDKDDLGFDDAKFMLVACSAFTTYVTKKTGSP